MKNIESIRHLKNAAQTLRTLRPNFLKEIAEPRCDKHATMKEKLEISRDNGKTWQPCYKESK